MDAFELLGMAVITAVLAVTVRQYRPELGIQVSIAGGLLLLAACAAEYAYLPKEISRFFGQNGLDGAWMLLVLKLCGTAFITQIASELCRDAGENALACKTEFCGRVMMLASALPTVTGLLKTLFDLIDGIGL